MKQRQKEKELPGADADQKYAHFQTIEIDTEEKFKQAYFSQICRPLESAYYSQSSLFSKWGKHIPCSCSFQNHPPLQVAIDTEFCREFTLAIVQLAFFCLNTEEPLPSHLNKQVRVVFVITAHRTKVDFVSPTLQSILACPKLLKIAFDPRGDWRSLTKQGYVVYPEINWFDVQRVFRYPNGGAASLVNVIWSLFQHEILRKEEFQQKNWLTCFLNPECISYLIWDVLWIFLIYTKLKTRYPRSFGRIFLPTEQKFKKRPYLQNDVDLFSCS